jgi:hypothetical protein
LEIKLVEKERMIENLNKKVIDLEKVIPKQTLITENEALKAKNTNHKKILGVSRIEIARLKQFEEKYKNVLRKFGSESQRTSDHNTREEILESMGDGLRDHYEHFASQNFIEIETMNFVLINYLDLSGEIKLEMF